MYPILYKFMTHTPLTAWSILESFKHEPSLSGAYICSLPLVDFCSIAPSAIVLAVDSRLLLNLAFPPGPPSPRSFSKPFDTREALQARLQITNSTLVRATGVHPETLGGSLSQPLSLSGSPQPCVTTPAAATSPVPVPIPVPLAQPYQCRAVTRRPRSCIAEPRPRHRLLRLNLTAHYFGLEVTHCR